MTELVSFEKLKMVQHIQISQCNITPMEQSVQKNL